MFTWCRAGGGYLNDKGSPWGAGPSWLHPPCNRQIGYEGTAGHVSRNEAPSRTLAPLVPRAWEGSYLERITGQGKIEPPIVHRGESCYRRSPAWSSFLGLTPTCPCLRHVSWPL
nr:hypothetical protein [Candidatus Sigynarchaeota archaeon]